MLYLTNELWKDVEKQETQIERSVFNQLNRDRFSICNQEYIDKNGNKKIYFYIEATSSMYSIPNTVRNYVKQWGSKKGYIWAGG